MDKLQTILIAESRQRDTGVRNPTRTIIGQHTVELDNGSMQIVIPRELHEGTDWEQIMFNGTYNEEN